MAGQSKIIANNDADASHTQGTTFRNLAPELQQMIFTEALCKPHVHFVTAQRRDDKTHNKWTITILPVSKGHDRSGYRWLQTLSTISHASSRAVRLATLEKDCLPFPGLRNHMDTSTDLVCIDFNRPKHKPEYGHWNAKNQIRASPSHPSFNPEAVASKVGKVHKLAFTYHPRHASCSTRRNVFRCLPQKSKHRDWKICPEELVGLLDCFQNLEAVYIILLPGQKKEAKMRANHYTKNFFALSAAEREACGFEIFHDSKCPYIEVDSDPNSKLLTRTVHLGPNSQHEEAYKPELLDEIFEILHDARKQYLEQASHTRGRHMSLEKRSRVSFKVLLHTNRKNADI
ncbi:hypothetical protein B0H63DRAFT_522777 [Podospora didyma]|uniref:Uncharacterized protein n=1 Tax=Podospora didyma TaxID=330526 RepID=A0AAE0NPQ0_9PEZI|nr:hypothetical protein B0H63DRAFT_522777 [Podospora didyma]